jgi:hypothetical protein
MYVRQQAAVTTLCTLWMYLPAKVPLQYIRTPEAESKEKYGVLEPMPELTMCFQTLHSAPGVPGLRLVLLAV